MDSEKIILEVYDDNFSSKNEFCGIYECDFTYVYNQKNHCLQNFWIALVNPESEDFTKVRGYLRISVSVLHESDNIVKKIFKIF